MCKGRVCFNLLITPVYFEIVFAIDSVCEVHFICLLSVYVGGYGGLSESGLCVFCKSCPVCFLVVGKGPSVLL